MPSFNFQKLSSEDGLNNTNIFSICQQPDGQMVFTTQNGIYRYNGYGFVKLKTDSIQSNALLSAVYSQNKLFLSIRNEGLVPYDDVANQINRKEKIAIKDNNADVVIIKSPYVYLLTAGIKLAIYNSTNQTLFIDSIKANQRMNQAFCIFETKKGDCYVGRSDGLYRLIGASQVRVEKFPKQAVHSLSEAPDGSLVVGTASKIITWGKNGILNEMSPSYKVRSGTFDIGGGKSVNQMACDKYNKIWFTSMPDDALYLQEADRTYDIFSILDIPPSLIRCLFIDRDQNVWIGTFNDGVYCVQNTVFKNLAFYFNNKILNINQSVLKGNFIAVATANGLYGYNLANHTTKVISKPDDTFQEPVFSISAVNDIFYYTKYSSLYVSPAVFSGNNSNFTFRPVIAKLYLPVTAKWSVVADRELNILRCNADGTRTLDTLISFTDYRMSVNALLLNDSTLYVGTSSGLYTYNFTKKESAHPTKPVLNVHINDLANINGDIYAAHESGLTNINKEQLIQQVGRFQLNSVRKIKLFRNKIWLATIDGLFICDKEFQPVNILNKSKGLLSSTINDVTADSVNMVISTIRGVAIAPIQLLTDNKNASFFGTPRVTAQRVVDETVTITENNGLYALSDIQDNISIYLNSPNYGKPLLQYIQYRVDEGEWQLLNNALAFNVGFTGGLHQVEIIASFDNINFSSPLILKFKKEEKLSEKRSWLLLIALFAVVIISLVSVIWVRRVKVKARRRLEQEQQMNLLKHQAMNALLSPHFIFNSLTSIQNYINTNNSLRASEYLAKFSRLIRMIIEKAAQSDITLHDELARLTYYLELEKERFKNKFDYFIHLDERIDTHTIQIPNMIIQPHVENCIIHGILPKHEHGVLNVRFELKGTNQLAILIEDNGIGLIKAKEHAKTGHKSLGTSTISSILEINSRLRGKKQAVTMTDKSTLREGDSGTIIQIIIEL